jgi:tRNA U34 5-methylaminomethyl-2-thiouridine-forming methyltransferase MnmC
MLRIIKTTDGSHTLFVPEMNEHYHSFHGAIQESEYIFIKCGYDFCRTGPLRIFEAGFGTGLNALLTCIKATSDNREVNYSAIESYPLPQSLVDLLNYKDFVDSEGRKVFERLHSCKWETAQVVNKNFTLHKIKGDLTVDELSGSFDLIYFDAFGPDKQPEMWTENIFRKISSVTAENGILVTYSAKGSVQRVLRNNGFKVSLLPGPPGKRQIIRAVKI